MSLFSSTVLWAALVGLALFFAFLCLRLLLSFGVFLGRYGRTHRLTGLALLAWLVYGTVRLVSIFNHTTSDSMSDSISAPRWLIYDIVLGVLGTATAATAAYDFRRLHSRVKNRASGTLDEDATVTHAEMVEHAFYQGLNLIQVLVLHALESPWMHSLSLRMAAVLVITAPWLLRSKFPVNHFSDNYTQGQNALDIVPLIYRIKKYQYVLYKHFLLHGFNISVALNTDGFPVVGTTVWRLFWLCLNASYVMEFFLQTLVKRKYMQQTTMLMLQSMLMAASSVAAVEVIWQHTRLYVAVTSMLLNFAHRGHDVINTMLVFSAAVLLGRVRELY